MIMFQIHSIGVTTFELKGYPPRPVDGQAVANRIGLLKRMRIEPDARDLSD
jgi:hypothetical protein